MPESWDPDDDDWGASGEFKRVLRQFDQLITIIDTFDSRLKDLSLTMKDFQFALIQLFEKYPDLLEDSPEGKKLMEASKKVSKFDLSKWIPNK